MLSYDNQSKVAKVYKDGEFIKSFAAPPDMDLTHDEVDGPAVFQIRGGEQEDDRFMGDISRVRLYDFVLGDDEVRGNFDFGNTEGSSGGLVIGDVNNDGIVDFIDITPFINAQSAEGDEDAFLLLTPDGCFLCADIDMDGAIDFLDITPFVNLLDQVGTAVPEPASAAFLIIGLATMRRRTR